MSIVIDTHPTTELAQRPKSELAAVGGNKIGDMLQAMIDKGIGPDTADAMKTMTELYLKVDANNARKEFAIAMAALQAELPRVAATRVIPDKNNNPRSVFANYEDIMERVGPYLQRHGFSVAFNMQYIQGPPQRLAAVCKLTHTGGHSETNEFAVRCTSGPPGCSEAQVDGSARSYARRGALCDALNIVIDHDDDARLDGGLIDAATIDDLRRRIAAVGGNEALFLGLGSAPAWEHVRQGSVPAIEQAIRARAKTRQNAPGTPQPARAPTPGPAAAPVTPAPVADDGPGPATAPNPAPLDPLTELERLWQVHLAAGKTAGEWTAMCKRVIGRLPGVKTPPTIDELQLILDAMNQGGGQA
jgi:hypothetical protein